MSEDPRKVSAKADFELGLSLRTIGAKVGVSGTMVQRWAKEFGWQRLVTMVYPPPLPPHVPAPHRALTLVSGGKEGGAVTGNPAADTVASVDAVDTFASVNPPEVDKDVDTQTGGNPVPAEPAFVPGDTVTPAEGISARARELLMRPTQAEAFEVAARAVVQVVREHRVGVARSQRLVTTLLGQLELAVDCRDLLEDFIHDECKGDKDGRRRAAMLKLVSLATHAGTIKDLASSMQKLVALERQAFGLVENDDPSPAPPPPAAIEAKDDDFARIREKARERIEAAARDGQIVDVEPKE